METQTKKNETVGCPRCGAAFECKVDDINLCQCVMVQLDDNQRNYVRSLYDTCLCVSCLQEVRTEYNHNQHREIMDKFPNAH
ncbi:hypothetical protein GCM10027347_23100 [Larkinella harenae]